VWNLIPDVNLGQYSGMHLTIIDILALADVFEIFRNACYRKCKSDPMNYFTVPGVTIVVSTTPVPCLEFQECSYTYDD